MIHGVTEGEIVPEQGIDSVLVVRICCHEGQSLGRIGHFHESSINLSVISPGKTFLTPQVPLRSEVY